MSFIFLLFWRVEIAVVCLYFFDVLCFQGVFFCSVQRLTVLLNFSCDFRIFNRFSYFARISVCFSQIFII